MTTAGGGAVKLHQPVEIILEVLIDGGLKESVSHGRGVCGGCHKNCRIWAQQGVPSYCFLCLRCR